MRHSFIALALLAVGCSAASDRSSDPAPTQLPESWTMSSTSEAMHLTLPRTGPAAIRAPEDAEPTTLAFVAAHRDLFQVNDPAASLTLRSRETDSLGITHVRFRQTHLGIPVWGAELSAHFDRAGHLTEITSTSRRDLEHVDPTPSIAKEDALRIGVANTGGGEAVTLDESKLVIYGKHLAWQLNLRDDSAPAVWTYLVDAHDGAVLHVIDDLKAEAATAKGTLGHEHAFDAAKRSDGSFAMETTVNGVTVRTFDAKNTLNQPGTLITSNNANQWDPAGADAHGYAIEVVKYYKDHHDRLSIDGLGGTLISEVHYDVNFANAFWNGKQMTYGDGNGTTSHAFSADAGVVAHELSHGVTERTSSLIYENASGALNEAFSDIMAVCFAHAFKPDPVRNWIIGLDLQKERSTVGSGARYIPDPIANGGPGHISERLTGPADRGGVHSNSQIWDHAMYLMTVGGTQSTSKIEVKYGIGFEKAEKLFYRANTKYWIESSDFTQAAAGVKASAKDLAFTENEQNIVDCGLKAVGILDGACAVLTDPTPQTKPPTTTETETPTAEAPAAGDDSEADDESEDDDAPKSRAKKSAPAATTGGCNAGGSNTISGEALVLAAALIAARRRKKR